MLFAQHTFRARGLARAVATSQRAIVSQPHLTRYSRMTSPRGTKPRASQDMSPLGHDHSVRLASTSTAPPLRFHTFDVSLQVFVERKHALALVNLKPIVPLHVLVIPRHPYASLDDIPRTPSGRAELHDLFETVQDVAHVCRQLTGAAACTIAIQDGKEAGQSVPHVHVHILPRKDGDFVPKDTIYDHLEAFGLGLHKAMTTAEDASDQDIARRASVAPDSQDRKARSAEEMAAESTWLREQFGRIMAKDTESGPG